METPVGWKPDHGTAADITAVPNDTRSPSYAPPPLAPGDPLLPALRRWHTLITTSTEGTPFSVVMLFECGGKRYYGSRIGGRSRLVAKGADVSPFRSSPECLQDCG